MQVHHIYISHITISLVPLFQGESKCKTIFMKMTDLHENERFRTYTRFETEAQEYSKKPQVRTFAIYTPYCWFSHDVTNFQTSELLILLRFYFHDVLEQLETNIQTNFHSKWVLGLVIDYA